MKDTLQKRWLLDAALLIGFLTCFFLDLTGVALHQWLGIAAGALAAYHLLSHSDWVEAVTRRFFGRTSAQARLYYLIDALLLFGFTAMIGTGLVISTWLNLSLAVYAAWRTVHVLSAILTLLIAVLKVSLHQGWIVSVGRRVRAPARAAQPANVPQRQPAVQSMNRRAFLQMMGVVGIASLLAFSQGVQGLAATSDAQSASATGATSTTGLSTGGGASSSGSSCTVRCKRGSSGGCSFPGNCHNYRDTSGTGRCDLGECASGFRIFECASWDWDRER